MTHCPDPGSAPASLRPGVRAAAHPEDRPARKPLQLSLDSAPRSAALDADTRFWDRLAPRYARSKVSDPGAWSRTLARTQDRMLPGDRVLELGCGTGSSALRLAGSVRDYLATDISARMIGIAEGKLAGHTAGAINPQGLSFAQGGPGTGNPSLPQNLTFRTATAEDLFGERPFDLVLGFNYLHMVRDLRGTLAHLRTLLRSGGLLITKTPCVGDMNLLLRRVLLPAMQWAGRAPHVGVFRQDELTDALRRSGFEILELENHATRGNDHRPWIVARRL